MENPATGRIVLADFVGFIALAAETALVFYWLVQSEQRGVEWMLAFLVLSVGAFAVWHGKNADKAHEFKTWLGVIAVSVILGAFSFGVDMLIASHNNPGLSPVEAGTRAGGAFGFVFTILICPGLTMIGLAGLVRCLVLRSTADEP